MHTPRVTVLMPVFNAGIYLDLAVQSILSQTFTDFELLIIDDGSTDGSFERIAHYQDQRIRLEVNHKNQGLVYSLNRGIQLSRGEYIARMDGDDFSLPERLAIQVEFMDSRPDIGICGSWIQIMDSVPIQTWRYPIDHEAIRCRLIFASAMAHPAVIMRRSILLHYQLLYDPRKTFAEDYAFWCECSKHIQLANIPRVLLDYRFLAERPDFDAYLQRQQAVADQIRLEQLARLGICASPMELIMHRDIALHMHQCTQEYLEKCREWLERILAANQKSKVFASQLLARELGNIWLEICRQAKPLGWAAWQAYRTPGLSVGFPKHSRSHWMFLCSCIFSYTRAHIKRMFW